MVRYTPEGLSLARTMWAGEKGQKKVVICPHTANITLCRRQRRFTRYACLCLIPYPRPRHVALVTVFVFDTPLDCL